MVHLDEQFKTDRNIRLSIERSGSIRSYTGNTKKSSSNRLNKLRNSTILKNLQCENENSEIIEHKLKE